jgi:hypothetical protein
MSNETRQKREVVGFGGRREVRKRENGEGERKR